MMVKPVSSAKSFEVFAYTLSGRHSYPRLTWPRAYNRNDENFGDALSIDVVRNLADPSALSNWRPNFKRSHLMSIGSILHFTKPGDVVWGSGIHFEVQRKLRRDIARELRIEAIRGPYTAEWLEKSGYSQNWNFGDPGLLAPIGHLNSSEGSLSEGVVIIPNHSHLDDYRDYEGYVSPIAPWQKVAAAISSSELVVTSSLHATILADLLGKPRSIFKFPSSDGLKFWDYESGLNQDFKSPIHATIEKAFRASPSIPKSHWISQAQQRLVENFPYDLKLNFPRMAKNALSESFDDLDSLRK